MAIEKDDGSFLFRWSQRKLDQAGRSEDIALERTDQQVEPDAIINTESVAEEALPIWQQQNIDSDTKKQALKALFKQSKFGALDGLNEYDEDYTTFPGLDDVVTKEMKRMLKLAEEKTRLAEFRQQADGEINQADADVEDEDKDIKLV